MVSGRIVYARHDRADDPRVGASGSSHSATGGVFVGANAIRPYAPIALMITVSGRIAYARHDRADRADRIDYRCSSQRAGLATI